MRIDEVDLAVLHQANIRILDAAAEELGIDRRKLFVNLEQYGNTSAGSIPLALDEAMQQGRIHNGSKLLLCGFGAGLAWGTALWRW
jgi:3-oxoacyl-[acyl-carrier-protein] synthase-3